MVSASARRRRARGSSALAELFREPAGDKSLHGSLHLVIFYFFQNIGGKRLNEHFTRFLQRNPPGLQIVKRFFVDLPNRCAMCAFHVISPDFELRLGIDMRFR